MGPSGWHLLHLPAQQHEAQHATEGNKPGLQKILRPQADHAPWTKYLETVEGRYYDEKERLIEDRLGDEDIHSAKLPGSTRAAGLESASIGH